jgi:hypothetical protein
MIADLLGLLNCGICLSYGFSGMDETELDLSTGVEGTGARRNDFVTI